MAVTSPGKVSTLRISHTPWEAPLTAPAMSNAVDRHDRYRLTNRYVEVEGSPRIPVSGEIHFSRLPRGVWEERLRLMRAGGITVAACYVFWLHHEPQEGEVSFDGNLDVAAFVRLCASVGLDVVLRIGPWCHGEARNGGFPDWVQAAGVRHRTNDPAYLRLVEPWFSRLGAELGGLTGPDSNIIGIQLENELYDQPDHIRELKALARSAGLNAPIWTATAWGGADLPQDDVLPLFGGYGDGFWVDADAPWDVTFREHYFFSHVWDDPGIGADLREHLGPGASAAPPRTPSALYPAATCELAGGMATAYQRRPWPRGLDVAAVAHNKIGNGSAWQGYYMFAGGTNPGDNLQESQATGYPNDLPRFDYDFHAPIGTSGRLSASFAQLRRQHAFLAAFGGRLAQMPSSLPDARPDGVDDASTLRWALRCDGQSGFVFVTWHQPHIPLEEHPATRFEVELGAGTVEFPSRPVAIPPGTIAHWPLNLEIGGICLEWATASPLTVLRDGPATTLVLAAEPGIAVELRLKQGTTLTGPATALADHTFTVEADTPAVLTVSAGDASLGILVLPPGDVARAWVLDTVGGRELVLSTDPVWVAASGRLAGRSAGVPDVLRYSQVSASFEAVDTEGSGTESSGTESSGTAISGTATAVGPALAELLRPALPVPPSFGSAAGRASAPTAETIAGLAQVYRITLPADAFLSDGPAGGASTELEIHWAGDVAQLLVDGRAVADRFWDGSPWIVDVRAAGIGPDSDVVLHLLPLAAGAAVGLPLEARRRRDRTPADLVSLDSLRVVRWRAWTEPARR